MYFVLNRLLLSRKRKIEGISDTVVTMLFSILVKSRIVIDFRYYKATKNMMYFEQRWCVKNIICNIIDDVLIFNSLL